MPRDTPPADSIFDIASYLSRRHVCPLLPVVDAVCTRSPFTVGSPNGTEMSWHIFMQASQCVNRSCVARHSLDLCKCVAMYVA